jgi:hypothetical protein
MIMRMHRLNIGDQFIITSVPLVIFTIHDLLESDYVLKGNQSSTLQQVSMESLEYAVESGLAVIIGHAVTKPKAKEKPLPKPKNLFSFDDL